MLTEAGKIALTNIIKQQGLSAGTLISQDGVLTEVTDDTVVSQESSLLGAGEVMEGEVEQGLVDGEEGQVRVNCLDCKTPRVVSFCYKTLRVVYLGLKRFVVCYSVI